MSKKVERFTECPSCGHELIDTDKFCPSCGQANKSIRHSLLTLLINFFEDYIAFDSKLFRTLVPLVSKPGFLTLEFIAHKRSRYVSPLRLYLFTSFVFFLITSLVSEPVDFQKMGQEEGLKTEIITIDSVNVRPNQTKMDSILAIDVSSLPEENKLETELLQGTVRLLQLPPKMRDDMIRGAIPIALIGSIPLIALFLYLLNWKQPRYYVDDIVFTAHYLSFMLFAFLVMQFLLAILNIDLYVYLAFLIGLSAYFLVAFKRVYGYQRKLAIFYGGLQLSLLLFILIMSLVAVVLYVLYFNVVEL